MIARPRPRVHRAPSDLRADFVANMQAAYRTLDMRRVPRVQPLQFPPSADRTAATQLLIRSMRRCPVRDLRRRRSHRDGDYELTRLGLWVARATP